MIDAKRFYQLNKSRLDAALTQDDAIEHTFSKQLGGQCAGQENQSRSGSESDERIDGERRVGDEAPKRDR